MNNTKMTVSVKRTHTNCGSMYEGIVTMPNLTEAKLKKSDGSTTYGNLSSLKQAAQNLSEKLFLDLNFVNKTKIAAKKSVR